MKNPVTGRAGKQARRAHLFARGFVGGAMVENLHLREGHESVAEHGVEVRQEAPEVFLGVHNFDEQRQVLGKARDFCGVQMTARAETHRAAQHGRAGQAEFARLADEGLVERLVLPAIVFAEVDAEEFAGGGRGRRHGNFTG